MPNRYEREIEEILRNLEHTESKPNRGPKFGERLRRKPAPPIRPRPRSSFSFRFTKAEWLLIVAVGSALLAGGYAYAQGHTDIFTGVIAVIGIVSLLLMALSAFIFRPGGSTSSRYENVTALRRGPFANLRTRWNLFMLKIRYRRKK